MKERTFAEEMSECLKEELHFVVDSVSFMIMNLGEIAKVFFAIFLYGFYREDN